MAKKEINGDPIKVKSKSDIPKDAVLVKGEDGRDYYEVKSKSTVPPSTKPTKKIDTEKSSVSKRATSVPVKPTGSKPSKTPPVQSEKVERYYIEPTATTTVTKTPEDRRKEAFQALGWEGTRYLEPKLTQNLPPFYAGGKKANVFGYYLPAKRDTNTGAWSSNEGLSTGGTEIYGYEDPTTGEVKLMDLLMMQGKDRDINGKKEYAYTEEDIVPYSNVKNVEQNLKQGALRQIADETYLNSLGGPKVDRTKDVIGAANTASSGAPNLKNLVTTPDVNLANPQLQSVTPTSYQSGDVKSPAIKTMKIDPLLQQKKKGGLVQKYAVGGPVANPYIKTDYSKWFNQLKQPDTQSIIPPVNEDVIIQATPKVGLAGKFGALPVTQKASIYSAAGDITGTGVDLLDRKDGRSSIAGQAGSGALKGAGKGAALGSMLGPQGTAAGAIIGAGIGGTMGAIRGKKEKRARIDETSAEFSDSAANATFDPMNPNKITKAETYNEKDYRTGIKGLFSKGGQIVGKGTGTSDSIDADIKGKSFIVPAKNSGLAKLIRRDILLDDPNKKVELNQGGVPVKVSNGEHQFTPEEVKELTAKGIDLNKLAPEAKTKLRSEFKFGGLTPSKATEILHDKSVHGHPLTDKQRKYMGAVASGIANLATGGVADGVPDYASMYKKEYKKKTPAKGYSKPKGLAALGINQFPTPQPGEDEVIVPGSAVGQSTPNPLAVPAQYRNEPGLNTTQADILNKTALAAERVPTNEVVPQSKYKFNMGDAAGVGLAGLQAGFGLQQLLKDKRPVGRIDPAFNQATEQALLQSKYGYTPEQAALLSGQITQGRVAQTAGINAMAGGNAAVGLTNTRAAINQEVANRLKMASEDERLRMQKQQYANQLVSQRAGMGRQLFQDKMNQFQQNQEAGASLLGAGIQNIVGQQRYAQERAAQDQINKTMFGYLNNIPK